MTTDSTRPVPTGDGYTQPATVRTRIAEQLRKLPRVDANGNAIDGEDPTVVPITGSEVPAVTTDPAPIRPSGSHTTVPAPTSGATTLDRIRQTAGKHLDQPLPAGYVPGA